MKTRFIIRNNQPIYLDEEPVVEIAELSPELLKGIENKILLEYVSEKLDTEKKELAEKKDTREWRTDDYKKISLFCTGASVVMPVAISLLTGMYKDVTNTVFGETNAMLAFCAGFIPSCLIITQLLASYGLSLRPSLNSISGKENKVFYLTELYKGLKTKEEVLKGEELDYSECTGIYEIDFTDKFKYIDQMANLRYVYGNQHKKVVKLFKEDKLEESLKELKFLPKVIADFIEFVNIDLSCKEMYQHDMSISL